MQKIGLSNEKNRSAGILFSTSRLPDDLTIAAFIAEFSDTSQLFLTDANAACLALMQTDAESVLGRNMSSIEQVGGLDALAQELLTAFRDNDLNTLSEGLLAELAGRRVRLHVTPLINESGRVVRVICLVRELVEGVSTDSLLKRLNRELFAVSACNQALLRAEDESSLLEEICRIIHQVAGYRMAWVGFREHDQGKHISPMAWAGEHADFLQQAQITWGDEPRGYGPSGRAMRSGQMIALQDVRTDPLAEPWRQSALASGFLSGISLPLKDSEGDTFGVLTIYASQPNVFTPDESRLLEGLAADLAFGINVLRARIAHRRGESERRANLHFFQSMDRVNRAIQRSSSLAQMMSNVLDDVLDIFDCHRAYLLYPCDPAAPTWRAPMERTRPEYPGVHALNLEMENDAATSDTFRQVLEAEGALQFGEGVTRTIPGHIARQFNVRNMMNMALRPRHGKPWLFGIHECASARVWSAHEERLLAEIGQRLEDGLTSMLIFRDLQASELNLKTAERNFHTLVDNLPDFIARFDRDGKALFANRAVEEAFGVSSGAMLGRNVSAMVSKNDEETAQLLGMIRQAYDEGEANRLETQWFTQQGVRSFDVAHIPEKDEEGRVVSVLGIAHDISERKFQQEQLSYQAHYDSLTGLPNRYLAMDRLEQNIKQAIRNGTLTALLFLDLDDFKKINDALGHEVGDQVLVLAANRLERAVRTSDTVARLGGDEFIILIQELNHSEDIRPVAENIVLAFQEVFQVMGRQVMLTASLGIAVYPVDGNDPLVLLRNADTAMYHSKAMGRNAYQYFTDSMNQHVAQRLQMEEQLRLALERNEFSLVYQPIINVANGRIVAVEALLRWRNQLLGQVPTNEFIEVAEQTGLIIGIGGWVIRAALHQLARWRHTLPSGFRLAVNVSPRQFRQVDFVDDVERALEAEGVEAGMLELEITEGMLLSGEAGAAEVIARLRTLGVAISMDDFGTGYSSLSYLRKYRFDTIKIDRIFIRDIIDDPNDRELIIATLRMARSFNAQVVAEGVETAEQLAFLRRESCDCAQGYYLSRPISAHRLTEMLASGDCLGLAPGE